MPRFSRLILALLVLLAPLLAGFDCDGGALGEFNPPTWTNAQGTVTVHVNTWPFGLTLRAADGHVLLESTTAHNPGETVEAGAPADPITAYAPLAITHDTDISIPNPLRGWNYFRGLDDPWKLAGRVSGIEESQDQLTVHVSTADPAHPGMTVTLSSQGIGVHIVAKVDAPGALTDDAYVNRVSLGFAMHDDDHFIGFGERYVQIDHRGQMLYTWVEEGSFAHGEGTPPGPSNPSPSGEEAAYMPIPWFMSTRGFGMLLNTTYRANFHLGEEAKDAWRVEATQPVLDFTVFADADPLNLIEALTEVTGRPPEVADWVVAPRRRVNIGTDEMDKLRAAHIPTSVIDTALHYFPNGLPASLQVPGAVKAITDDIHRRGFKAIAYFNSFVADSFHPVVDEAVQNGYLIKHPDGSPYFVLDPPYNAGIVDFTNPKALAWYQAFMQQALDDGWDGWMYDFGEYVPQDAVLFNGMGGFEAHNLYPLLFQQAAHDLLEPQRQNDYLIFVRSGYRGTGGLVPMVWAGDNSTDFDTAKGLPAVLVGGLNAGMSGIPLWGSDISGYHYVYNPPPDKELYLRWTEVGAFSADMHDENEGSGTTPSSTRWQIWDDQESQDVYRKYASYKTRMLPYVKVAVGEARARGTPVMRHLYLLYPTDPNVLGLTDEYMYGDSLLVAPVVSRGLVSRPVYLPEAQYYDFWSGLRVAGQSTVTASAPLDDCPVYAKVGAIVPMLSPDVETVVPSSDGSVISSADRADYLEVAVFAGGQTSITLDDGTTFSQSAPVTPFEPGAATHATGTIAAAVTAADLGTCDACTLDDPTNNVWTVAVLTQADTITAGPLTLHVGGSPNVKRFVFTVRH
jgi:alpha-glucosidase